MRIRLWLKCVRGISISIQDLQREVLLLLHTITSSLPPCILPTTSMVNPFADFPGRG